MEIFTFEGAGYNLNGASDMAYSKFGTNYELSIGLLVAHYSVLFFIAMVQREGHGTMHLPQPHNYAIGWD